MKNFFIKMDLNIKTLLQEIFIDISINIKSLSNLRINIKYNNRTILTLIIKDIIGTIGKIIEIENLESSNYLNHTGQLLDKVIILGRSLNVKKIIISGDESKIYFINTDKSKTIIINLYELSLLEYGLTWYNRYGFGFQKEEWEEFISQPLFPFLTAIDYLPENENAFLDPYTNCSISEAFKDIAANLKIISRKDGIYNVIENNVIEYVEYISNCIKYIMKGKNDFYVENDVEYLLTYYTPDIVSYNDLEFIL